MRRAPVFIGFVLVIGFVVGFTAGTFLYLERVALLETQITDYKQRLGEIPSENKYSKLSNMDLKIIGNKVVKDFREFINRLDREYSNLYTEYPGRVRLEEDPEYNRKWWSIVTRFQAEYDEKQFRTETVLLRNAIQSRLPENEINKKVQIWYERSNLNTFVLRDILNDLERLIKILP